MAGYSGYSMSNNAVAAYGMDEMPKSKWTKDAILSFCGDKAEMLSALTVSELRALLLEDRGWHHTSNHYNKTNFYGIDEDALDEITQDRVNDIVANRKPRENRTAPAVTTITAEISYTVWEGQYRNYRRPKTYTETVTYKSTDKMIQTQNGAKRLSAVKIVRILSETDES